MSFLNKNKIYISIVLLTILIVTSFAFVKPEKAEAQYEGVITTILDCSGATDWIADKIGSFWKSATGAPVPVGDSVLRKKESCLDAIGYGIAKTLLARLTQNALKWIDSGFNGDPMYSSNLSGYLNKVEGQIEEAFIKEIGLAGLCSPFQVQIQEMLVARNRFKTKGAQCSFDKIGHNLENFLTDFSQGGWSAWLTMTQLPENNIYGTYLMLENELNNRQQQKTTEINDDLNRSGGFFSLKYCEVYNIEAYGYEYGSPLEDIVTMEEMAMEDYKNGDSTACKVEKTKTPGDVARNVINNSIASPQNQLELADEFTESLSVFFNQLIVDFLSGGEDGGLSGLGETASGSGSRASSEVTEENLFETIEHLTALVTEALEAKEGALVLIQEIKVLLEGEIWDNENDINCIETLNSLLSDLGIKTTIEELENMEEIIVKDILDLNKIITELGHLETSIVTESVNAGVGEPNVLKDPLVKKVLYKLAEIIEFTPTRSDVDDFWNDVKLLKEASETIVVANLECQDMPWVKIVADPNPVATAENSTTLKWTSGNIVSCEARAERWIPQRTLFMFFWQWVVKEPTIWAGSKPTSGSEGTEAIGEYNTKYTILCTGPQGSVEDEVIVAVSPKAGEMALSLTLEPNVISSGGNATINWSSTNTTSCVASGDWSGEKNTSGSEPTENVFSNKKYILSCTDGNGIQITKNTTLFVDNGSSTVFGTLSTAPSLLGGVTVTLTRTGGTATGNISYRFKCLQKIPFSNKRGYRWGNIQNENTTSCQYGYYSSDQTIIGEITQGGVTATYSTTYTNIITKNRDTVFGNISIVGASAGTATTTTSVTLSRTGGTANGDISYEIYCDAKYDDFSGGQEATQATCSYSPAQGERSVVGLIKQGGNSVMLIHRFIKIDASGNLITYP